MKSRIVTALLLIALIGMGYVPAVQAAPPVAGGPEVSPAIYHDVSQPLRNMTAAPSTSTDKKEHPVRPLVVPSSAPVNDPVVQARPGPAVSTSAGLGFAGVGKGDYGFSPNAAPPDTNMAVGATQVVQWVNESFAVFDKSTGALLLGPKAGNSLWVGFGGGCETNNDGDPIVQYDQLANRWVLTQFSVSTTPYLQCVAVSTTSDATGTYNRYAFSYGTSQFPDYPKLGVWPDAYYISYNIFNNGSTWAGAKACAFDRSQMLVNGPATQVCYQLSTSYGGLLPADLDGTTAPPSGAPNIFLNFGTNVLNLWKFHVDFATPANSYFNGAGTPGTSTTPLAISVASFSTACSGGTCIVQPNTSQKLDSLADRLMYRLSYRNFGTYQSLLVNHSVQVGTRKRTAYSGVRWYELRDNGSGYGVYQQSTFAPDSTFRWMGSIAQDKQGNIALGYSASSSSVFPSLRYTGRLVTDALGTMQAETVLKAGGGSQLPNLSRWGDYSTMDIDPVDGCTFWFTSEYLKSSGTFNWSTWISSFKFPGCQ